MRKWYMLAVPCAYSFGTCIISSHVLLNSFPFLLLSIAWALSRKLISFDLSWFFHATLYILFIIQSTNQPFISTVANPWHSWVSFGNMPRRIRSEWRYYPLVPTCCRRFVNTAVLATFPNVCPVNANDPPCTFKRSDRLFVSLISRNGTRKRIITNHSWQWHRSRNPKLRGCPCFPPAMVAMSPKCSRNCSFFGLLLLPTTIRVTGFVSVFLHVEMGQLLLPLFRYWLWRRWRSCYVSAECMLGMVVWYRYNCHH